MLQATCTTIMTTALLSVLLFCCYFDMKSKEVFFSSKRDKRTYACHLWWYSSRIMNNNKQCNSNYQFTINVSWMLFKTFFVVAVVLCCFDVSSKSQFLFWVQQFIKLVLVCFQQHCCPHFGRSANTVSARISRLLAQTTRSSLSTAQSTDVWSLASAWARSTGQWVVRPKSYPSLIRDAQGGSIVASLCPSCMMLNPARVSWWLTWKPVITALKVNDTYISASLSRFIVSCFKRKCPRMNG